MELLKGFFLGIMGFVLKVVLAVVVAISTLIAYFSLQMILFARGDFLLFVAKDYNIIPAIMLMILIIYGLMYLGHKLFNSEVKQTQVQYCEFPLEVHSEENYKMDEYMDLSKEKPITFEELSKGDKITFKLLERFVSLDRENLNTKLYKVLKIVKFGYIPAVLIAMYLGTTSYSILYTDSIKLSSPMVPSGIIYKYSDIKTIEVGVKKGLRKDYSPYYKLTFKDGKTVDFFGGAAHEDHGLGFENILNDLDEKLLAQGVTKSVNKANFEKYSKGLDKTFISKVEKLFDNK